MSRKENLVATMTTVTGPWTKEAGPRPTSKELAMALEGGYKKGTKKWVAIAMYLRKKGATQKEVTAVLKGPHLNCWRDLKTFPAKWEVDQEKHDKHFSYTLRLVGPPK